MIPSRVGPSSKRIPLASKNAVAANGGQTTSKASIPAKRSIKSNIKKIRPHIKLDYHSFELDWSSPQLGAPDHVLKMAITMPDLLVLTPPELRELCVAL